MYFLFCSNLQLNVLVSYLIFKVGATFGEIKRYEYGLNMKSSASLYFSQFLCCRLLVGSDLTIVLHACVHWHTNNFICSYYIKANFIRFDLVVIPGSSC